MIYLIRHGQTDWNIEKRTQGHIDIPLNKTGEEQAISIAQEISNLKIDQIFSSDLKRAKQTAQIINQFFNLPITYDKRLREFNYGQFEGRFSCDISEAEWDLFNKAPEQLNAESKEAVYKRVNAFCDQLDKTKNILIITHGGIMRMLLYCIQNNWAFKADEFSQFFKNTPIPNLSIIQWDKGKNTCSFKVNETR